MTNTELLDVVDRLKGLLTDARPGLMSWNQMVAERIDDIATSSGYVRPVVAKQPIATPNIEAKERRRYALLQAAATILPSLESAGEIAYVASKVAVSRAEDLLEEIESRGR